MTNFNIIKKFTENCQQYPNDIAIINVQTDNHLTYHELDIASGKVYRYLSEHNIGKEDVVLILLPRGEKPFVSLVGVWKAGAAYILQEEDSPKEKIEFIKKDANCKLIIDSDLFEEIMRGESLSGYKEADAHDLSFIVYTSGTTGKPKGIMHEYGTIELSVKSAYINNKSLFQRGDCFLSIIPFGFAANLILFHPLISAGATIVIAPFTFIKYIKNIEQLLSIIIKYKINFAFFIPSLLYLVSNLPQCIKKLILAAEPIRDLYFDNVDAYCLYGQSEAAFSILAFLLDKKYDLAPSGNPTLSEAKVCLLDDDGNPVKKGEVGELCYHQPYLRGYLNLPEKNTDLFINGYVRSGDLAKRLSDGNYQVLSRKNGRVRINGNVIEPDEIEVAIKKVLKTKWVGVKIILEKRKYYICAYYIGNPVISIDKAKEIISKELASFKCPNFYIQIDKIPLSPNGKFFRNNLPDPDFL